MSGVATAIVASSVIGGVISSQSSKSAARKQAASADAATAAQLAIHDDTMERNDKYVSEAGDNYNKQIEEIRKLHESTSAELDRAYREQDQAAIQRLNNQLNTIEQNYNDISSQISNGENTANGLFADSKNVIDASQAQDQGRIADGRALTDGAVSRMGNNNQAVGAELQRVQALGSKPEGYDAAQSELDSSFRDAEAEIRRQNGGQLSDAEKLNLEINKSKARGSLSGNMRQNWAQQRSGMIGNLAGQANSGEAMALNADGTMRQEENANNQFYMGNNLNLNSQKLYNAQTFLDKKLANADKYGSGKLLAQDAYDTTKASGLQTLSTNKINNNSNLVSSNNSALINLQGVKANAMGVTANTNNNMANIYGNIAQTNIAGANQNAAAAGQALASIPSTAMNMYGAYKSFGNTAPAAAPTPAPTAAAAPVTTPFWT